MLSAVALTMQPSAIRTILQVAEQPEVISFAGGLPDPDLFPVEAIAAAFASVLAEEGGRALQYAVTEGHGPLRAWAADRLGCPGVGVEQVSIVTGSQQGLDLLGRVLLDPGDAILVERPTYLGAAQAFAWQQPRFVGVACDADGPLPEAVDDAALRHRAKLLYVMPNFQNPAGSTVSLARRRALVEVALRRGLILVEDDPYGELRYRGATLPSLLNLGAEAGAPVIHLGTFSKVLSPGLRLGYVATRLPLLHDLNLAKQAACLHVSTLTQLAVTRLLMGGFDLAKHLDRLRAAYGTRLDVMDAVLHDAFPTGLRWVRPDGGMFLWARVDGPDIGAWFAAALERRVAFVPGDDFFADGSPAKAVRLNFSHASPPRIVDGVGRLRTAWDAVAEGTAGGRDERRR